MLERLSTTDATRAPLHPLILQQWIAVFGHSEAAARSLSATLGLVTIVVIFSIGRRLAGKIGGLWAAGLCAFSPLVIEYDRETRMYALLTLLTCACWDSLLAFRSGGSRWRWPAHTVLLTALLYAHPLGVLMAGTLGLAALVDWRPGHWTIRRFTTIHGVAALAILPWLRRYLDHAPEFTSGRLGIRFLLGMPIGFIGGESRIFAIFLCLIAIGLIPWAIPGLSVRKPSLHLAPIVLWLLLPPTFLYVYSWIGHPIFGPSRYNVYVAPAFLVLCAAGLARLRRFAALTLLVMLLPHNFYLGAASVIEKPRKAAWRSAADYLDTVAPKAPVVVIPPEPERNFEIVVARYYLDEQRTIIPMKGDLVDNVLPELGPNPGRIFFSVSLRRQVPAGIVPKELENESRFVRFHNFSESLRLIEIRVGAEKPRDP